VTGTKVRGLVLVVDDLQAISAVFARILSAAGFEVERADTGRAALEQLKLRHFDAIVSDIAMPEMDGIALLRAVRECDLDVPVMLVTGHPTVDTALKAIEYGALRYLKKPVTPKDLITNVEQAVRLGRMARLKREALEIAGDSSMQFGDRAALEMAFERALQGLWMAYQPIVRYSDRRVIAFEALLRSTDPKLPTPDVMLSAADRLGKLATLGRAVRRHVGTTVASADIPQVFVNLHPTDLLDDELLSVDSPLCHIAQRVVLEITERASLSGIADLQARVAQLRTLGYRIAIDDVGAGYAGLTSIALLEPEVIKIDMALVRNIDREPTKRRIISAMASLCREMNVLVIAEGIETPAERDTLVSLGCDLMQGYLFAKPGKPFPTPQF
jgi:EAL domain-containing protein (putative c-di-GMP-specific phosphodiesterase class I)